MCLKMRFKIATVHSITVHVYKSCKTEKTKVECKYMIVDVSNHLSGY